jgi:uncharacterized membrane protein YvbJ
LHYDEGPSQEDIERFSKNEIGYCPHCSEEIWDDSTQCPACGEWLRSGTVHQDSTTRTFKKKFITIVAILVLLGFFWGVNRLIS